ncbi:MAG: RNA polymerase sigma factor [Candidatus Zixiibacteriota bacterium]
MKQEHDYISAIYLSSRKNLLNYCVYVLGDREAAAEVVQESFLRLMNRTPKLIDSSAGKNWLFICARNLCFSRCRQERLKRRYAPIFQTQDAVVTPESQRFIEEVLSGLTPEERELILLREQQQFSINEIAELTESSAEAIRVRLYRIRKKMQKIGEM